MDTSEPHPTRYSLSDKKLVGCITEDYLTELKSKLQNRMQHTGYFWCDDVILISDGASWIENLFQELFPNSEMVLDWYHAIENLWRCGNEVYGEGSEGCKAWVRHYKDSLWEGKILELLKLLREESMCASKKHQTYLFRLYHYYNERKERMKYKEFRDKGYPIGSGAIESANSYSIQNRLKRSRMRWRKENANYMAHLRNVWYSGEWKNKWAIAK